MAARNLAKKFILLRRLQVASACRCYSSALYVTGDKAREQYAPLVPYLDFGHKLTDTVKLRRNLELRKYALNVDELLDQWELYRSVVKRMDEIERRRGELQKSISQCTDTERKEQLRAQAVLARDDLKALKESSYGISDAFIATNFLSIPNDLHLRTPLEENEIVHHHKTEQQHTETRPIPKDWLDQLDPTCYYLNGDAALIDLFLPIYCSDHFKAAGYILFSNPDFARSVLVEAAAMPLESLHTIKEEDGVDNKLNLLHLCGGGTLLGFLGYFARLSVFPTALPLRLVATGKRYGYDQCQSNTVQVLATAQTSIEADELFDEILQLYRQFFEQLPLDFRLTRIAAKSLQPAESMRVDVEVFCESSQRFVKVGELCHYTDYISKRIMFNYHEGKVQKYPHIVGGQILSTIQIIRTLLADGHTLADLPCLQSFLPQKTQ